MSIDKKHECENPNVQKHLTYGATIMYCVEGKDGRFYAGNGEYESAVDYCPFCGKQSNISSRVVRENVNTCQVFKL